MDGWMVTSSQLTNYAAGRLCFMLVGLSTAFYFLLSVACLPVVSSRAS